jgi:ribosomal protein L37AE/L43A
MVTPSVCPNCGSDFIGIDPMSNIWVCFDCGYRIAPAGPSMIDPYFFIGH